MRILSLLLVAWFRTTNAQTTHASQASQANGVRGEPVVTCGDSRITVTVDTMHPFAGNMYTKGFFHKDSCRVKGWQSDNSTVELSVPMTSECGTRRKRVVNPRGLLFETTVILMFHRLFLTKVDKSYHVECFYLQFDREVSQSYDVSLPQPTDLPSGQLVNGVQENVDEVSKPVCTYEVLKGSRSGAPLKYASIGESVYHHWSCEGEHAEQFCMTVHSCVVDDGQGQGQKLLDDRGCTLDPFLLENLHYASDIEAGQTTSVFRFADRPTVFFSCQIRLEKRSMMGNCTRPIDICNGVMSEDVIETADEVEEESQEEETVTRRPVQHHGNNNNHSGVIESDFPRPPPLPIENNTQFPNPSPIGLPTAMVVPPHPVPSSLKEFPPRIPNQPPRMTDVTRKNEVSEEDEEDLDDLVDDDEANDNPSEGVSEDEPQSQEHPTAKPDKADKANGKKAQPGAPEKKVIKSGFAGNRPDAVDDNSSTGGYKVLMKNKHRRSRRRRHTDRTFEMDVAAAPVEVADTLPGDGSSDSSESVTSLERSAVCLTRLSMFLLMLSMALVVVLAIAFNWLITARMRYQQTKKELGEPPDYFLR